MAIPCEKVNFKYGGLKKDSSKGNYLIKKSRLLLTQEFYVQLKW